MDILYKLLSFFVGVVIFIAIIGTCENKNYQKNKEREARLNYEMYFNAVAESCLENSSFSNKLSKELKEGHLNNCLPCNFIIVNKYINSENWDDTVGELSEYDNIDTMVKGYLDFIEGKKVKCNHNYSNNSSKQNSTNNLLFYQSIM